MQISLEMQPEEDKSKKTPHERQNSFLFSNFLKKKKKKSVKGVGKNLFTADCKICPMWMMFIYNPLHFFF